MTQQAVVLPVLRKATAEDAFALKNLYKEVAKAPGGLVRNESEITDEYISRILNTSLDRGLMLVAQAEGGKNTLAGAVHAYKPVPKAFAHIFSDLRIVVHPDYQGKGIGRLIFSHFLETISASRHDILRVELVVRESFLRGILLYETLGFKREGRMECRIRGAAGAPEADIPMAWFNPNFQAR